MAIQIKETFVVAAPVERVWRFVVDPRQVVACMPGAVLDEVVDERTFLGTVSVKVGAITTRYEGKVAFAQIDEAAHTVEMTAEGRETGGGTARAVMSSRLRPLEGGATQVVAEASVDLTGRIMQMGRGMIQGVSHQIFQEFVACVQVRMEAQEGADVVTAPASPGPIRILPLVFRVLWAAVTGFVRRLIRRPAP